MAPELQLYIAHLTDKIMNAQMKNIWSDCAAEDLQKLFTLNVSEWPVNRQKLQEFYFSLFQILRITDGKTDMTPMFLKFLERNHLEDTAEADCGGRFKPSEEETTAAAAATQPSSSIKTIHVPMDKEVEQQEISINTTNASTDNEAAQSPVDGVLKDSPIMEEKRSEYPEPAPQDAPPELALEKDGVKLAELLLTWSRKQAQGTTALQEMIRISKRQHKRLEDQFSMLREELFAAKQELSDKLVENAELERELSDTRKQLKTARQEAENLNETVRKLQRMIENTAEQSVLGYKSELARSLKSIVEDVSIPEAQGDADILSALLGDLLDVLRFKGVPLEEQ